MELKWTEEQKEIFDHNDNLMINAAAGAAKTTTLVEYANRRPKENFLYLCFNRSVKENGVEKFSSNVDVKNIHSLAYRETQAYKYEIVNSINPIFVINRYKIQKKKGERNYKILLADFAIKKIEIFLALPFKSIHEVNLSQFYTSNFIKSNIDEIDKIAEDLYESMLKGETPITNNLYLKKYQLSEPDLDYDKILVDECQDLNGVMMDIVLRQEEPKKIFCGDMNQAIMRWNYAVNAFQMLEYDRKFLSKSFRFRQDIANLSMKILAIKKHFQYDFGVPKIYGLGNSKALQKTAFLSRTNIGLLQLAFEFCALNKNKKIYFEGNINNYLFSDGFSIYDIFYLFCNKKDKCKSEILKEFDSYSDFKNFIEETESANLKILCLIVEKYKGDIFPLINSIKANLTIKKDEADFIFTTTHKCKGLEYDQVVLGEDFISEEDILTKTYQEQEINVEALAEEVNILYVAATRAKNILKIPSKQIFNLEGSESVTLI